MNNLAKKITSVSFETQKANIEKNNNIPNDIKYNMIEFLRKQHEQNKK